MDKEVRPATAMEGVTLDGQRSVLIVDRSEETREVLQTALERRGLRTFAASRAERALALARQHRPDLIVLDLDLDDGPPETLSAPLAEQFSSRRTPLILLGSVPRHGPRPMDGEFVAKPYHYGLLIRKIEQLLGTAAGRTARSA